MLFDSIHLVLRWSSSHHLSAGRPIEAATMVSAWRWPPQLRARSSAPIRHPLSLSSLIFLSPLLKVNTGGGYCRRLRLLFLPFSSMALESLNIPKKNKYHLAFTDDEDAVTGNFCTGKSHPLTFFGEQRSGLEETWRSLTFFCTRPVNWIALVLSFSESMHLSEVLLLLEPKFHLETPQS